MARHVVEMHFVCRDDLNVTDLGDGTFETGVWAVSAEAAFSVRTVALHQDKATPSYWQGRVIGRTTQLYQGKLRYVFRVREVKTMAGQIYDPKTLILRFLHSQPIFTKNPFLIYC